MKNSVSVILAAVLLDLVLGDPRWLPHPVVYIGRLITVLERWLRQAGLDGFYGGMVLLVGTVGVPLLTAILLLAGSVAIHPWCGYAVATILAWTTLAARSLHRESGLIANALRSEERRVGKECRSRW